jgi:hypothetical protein
MMLGARGGGRQGEIGSHVLGVLITYPTHKEMKGARLRLRSIRTVIKM